MYRHASICLPVSALEQSTACAGASLCQVFMQLHVCKLIRRTASFVCNGQASSGLDVTTQPWMHRCLLDCRPSYRTWRCTYCEQARQRVDTLRDPSYMKAASTRRPGHESDAEDPCDRRNQTRTLPMEDISQGMGPSLGLLCIRCSGEGAPTAAERSVLRPDSAISPSFVGLRL